VSEGLGEHPATEREEQFGHVVLQTHRGEVYSLDLFETHETSSPGISCKGYCLPAAIQFLPTGQGVRRPTVPQSVPVEVELTADPDAFNAIYEMWGDADFGGEEGSRYNPEAPYSGDFNLGGPWRRISSVFSAQVSAPLQGPEKTVWTGRLVSKEGAVPGQFDFLLEQYGTIDPLLLLLVLFFLRFYESEGKRYNAGAARTSPNDPLLEYERCYRLALRLCGEGNIKSLNATTGLTGTTLRVDIGCNPECFERWYPANEESGNPPQRSAGDP
jgi:hypothetical protein